MVLTGARARALAIEATRRHVTRRTVVVQIRVRWHELTRSIAVARLAKTAVVVRIRVVRHVDARTLTVAALAVTAVRRRNRVGTRARAVAATTTGARSSALLVRIRVRVHVLTRTLVAGRLTRLTGRLARLIAAHVVLQVADLRVALVVGRAEVTQVAQWLTLVARAPETILTVGRANELTVDLVRRRVARRAARALTATPVVTAANLWIRQTRVVEALTDDRARGLTITLAASSLTRSVAAHTVGAEVRRALVVNHALIAVVLLRVALVGDAVRAVLTVVTRDALGVVRASLLTVRTITDVAIAEHVVMVDARSKTVTRVVRVVIASRAALRHADRTHVIEVASATSITRTVAVTGRRTIIHALRERVGPKRNRLTRARAVAHRAKAAGVIPVLVGRNVVLAEACAIAARALRASHGVRRVLTSAATVTHTTAKTRARALILCVRSVEAELALTLSASLVALGAKAVTS